MLDRPSNGICGGQTDERQSRSERDRRDAGRSEGRRYERTDSELV